MKHFIPLALDTYFRGNSRELEFCKKAQAGGNHTVVVTAGGRKLGKSRQVRLREKELAPLLEEFEALPEEERKPALPAASEAEPPRRKLPKAPDGGLVVRGYCTYMRKNAEGRAVKSREFYYKENPDRWAAETQSDMLWLTEAEWKSLVPEGPEVGGKIEVARAVKDRFFATMGIDYMEGSVNALRPRETSMTLTVEKVTEGRIDLRVDGCGSMGKAFGEESRKESHSRGCDLRILGYVGYDRAKKVIDRFDIVGLGRAWGNKMNYRGNSAIRVEEYPWRYGIATELVTGDSAIDRIPPYNLLHYGGAIKYWTGEPRKP